jgi:hypothetical protein
MDKIRRSYFWRGHKEAKGGHCLVAHVTVYRPLQLGGLGISNLKKLGWALRVKWFGYKKRSHVVHGHHFPFRSPTKSEPSLLWPSLQRLETVSMFCFGQVIGSKVRKFQTLLLTCVRSSHRQEEVYYQRGFHKS